MFGLVEAEPGSLNIPHSSSLILQDPRISSATADLDEYSVP